MTLPKKHGARIAFTDEQLGYAPDDWRYQPAGHEWYNPASQAVICDEDMPDELKPGTDEYLTWLDEFHRRSREELLRQLTQEGML